MQPFYELPPAWLDWRFLSAFRFHTRGPLRPETASGCPVLLGQEPLPRGALASCGSLGARSPERAGGELRFSLTKDSVDVAQSYGANEAGHAPKSQQGLSNETSAQLHARIAVLPVPSGASGLAGARITTRMAPRLGHINVNAIRGRKFRGSHPVQETRSG